MKSRSLRKEMLDEPGVPAGRLARSNDFMAFVNRHFGGAAAVISYFEKSGLPRSLTVLDLATGGGDIPFALARWAERTGRRYEITAVDANPDCVRAARERYRHPFVRYAEGSAFDLAALGTFDVVVTSMFLHHLADPDIVEVLKAMHRQSRLGFVVNDLYRSRLGWLGAAALAVFWREKMVLNDATLSVAKAFTERDFERYRQESGIDGLRIERRPWFRILLSRRG